MCLYTVQDTHSGLFGQKIGNKTVNAFHYIIFIVQVQYVFGGDSET